MTSATLPQLVVDDAAFESRCNALRDAPVIALDTEFMRVNTYSPVLCLIQIFDGREAVCIDAIEASSLIPLLDAVDQSEQPAVLHSGRQDLETFFVTEARLPGSLYDTQIAAAVTGPDDQLSYAQLVNEITGVELPKSQTRTNWAKRPLTDSQLHYAADDVLYLPRIKDHFDDALDRLDRRAWFEEDCQRLLDPALYTPDVDNAYRRCKSRRPLNDEQRGALRALCRLRELVAIDRDRPRKWIIDDPGLEALATLSAPDGDDIRRVLRKSKAHRAMRIDQIIQTIEDAEPVADDRPGRPTAEETAQVKTAMATLREVAESLDMAPGFLAPRRDVESLVRGSRKGPLLNGWRRDVVGEALLAAIDTA